jgi:hypothetical protein
MKKKKYQKPKLISYGKVSKITLSTGSSNGDGGPLMMA